MKASRVVAIAIAVAGAGSCYTSKSTSTPPDPGTGNGSAPGGSAGGFAQPPPSSQPPPVALPDHPPLCPKQDCPATAPLYPTRSCSDGVHTGGRGPCVRFPSGTCGYIHLVCPAQPVAACTGCGLPIDPVFACTNQPPGAFECVRDENGGCGVTYRACHAVPGPATAGGGAGSQNAPPPPPANPHPCSPLPDRATLMKWPVQQICAPGGGPAQPQRTFITALPDGTSIIEQLGKCVRVTEVKCYTKCLPPDARIATPSGDVRIAELRVGMPIWTQDAQGRRVVGRVERTASVEVSGEHHVARLVLSDGRTLVVSPEHPALHDRVEDLRAGDVYDGATIVTVALERYAGARTYDILPSGGVYWADGVPLRSTLAAP